jgi:hypothetical protein
MDASKKGFGPIIAQDRWDFSFWDGVDREDSG